MADVKTLIPAGGTITLRRVGDFVFTKFTDRPLVLDIKDGEGNSDGPVEVKNGSMRRPPGGISEIEVTNPDQVNACAAVFYIGKGDFDDKIIQGEVTVSPGVRGADGTFRDDTRTTLEMDVYPYRTNSVLIAQNERRYRIEDFTRFYPNPINAAPYETQPCVGTVGGKLGSQGIFIVFAKGAIADQFGVQSSFGNVWLVDSRLGIVTEKRLGYDLVPGSSNGSMCAYNGQIFGVGDASTDAAAGSVYNAETGQTIFVPSELSSKICATPLGILVASDIGADPWWLIDEDGNVIQQGAIPAGGRARAVWSEYHQAVASQFGNKIRVFPEWFDSSDAGMIELGGSAQLGNLDSNGFALFGEMVIAPANTVHEPTVPDESILATQLEDLTAPAGVEVVPAGCALDATTWRYYEGGDTDANISVMGAAPRAVLSGELVRYFLERWFNGRVGDDYLDHVFYADFPTPDHAGARMQKSSGGQTFAAVGIADQFIGRFPGKVRITIDNGLTVYGQGSL